jgi:hypothetical protein
VRSVFKASMEHNEGVGTIRHADRIRDQRFQTGYY